jgi:hypothetical protein
MLDAFIIEELKRKEQDRRRDNSQPQPELPSPSHDEGTIRQSDEEKPHRGVVIIDTVAVDAP